MHVAKVMDFHIVKYTRITPQLRNIVMGTPMPISVMGD
jgi:hypothetical protein